MFTAMRSRRHFLMESSLMMLAMMSASSCQLRQKTGIGKEHNALSAWHNSLWLPNWRMQKSLASALKALDGQCVTTLSPFWYEVDDTGTLRAKPGSDELAIPDRATIAALHKRGASVMPTLTTTLLPDNFIRLFAERAGQKRLAEAIRQEVLINGYDGIDLDLENIALTTEVSTAKKVREIYTDLCRCIASELNAVNKTLSITVMARWSSRYEVWRSKLIPAVYDYEALSGIASVLRVMAYDQHAPNTPPGPIAGFRWVESICDWTRRNVCSVDRVEIGIPLYGRDWGGGTVKSVLWDNMVQLRDMYPQSDVIYSDTEREITFAYTDKEGSAHQVWYSNSQSVTDRLALIQSYGFRGAALWAASYESPDLWEKIGAVSSGVMPGK